MLPDVTELVVEIFRHVELQRLEWFSKEDEGRHVCVLKAAGKATVRPISFQLRSQLIHCSVLPGTT